MMDVERVQYFDLLLLYTVPVKVFPFTQSDNDVITMCDAVTDSARCHDVDV